MENKCIICGNEGVKHFIILDKVFKANDISKINENNIVCLCENHRNDAEKTIISCEELRKYANIKNPIYPIHLPFTEFVKDYDRYGNPILKNNKRLKGYDYFEYKSYLNDIEHLFKDIDTLVSKYGRTYHFKFSPGTSSDDRIANNINNLLDEDIIFSEKLDGSNLSISKFGLFSRSVVDKSYNPWDKWLLNKWELIKDDLKSFNLDIIGENMYGVHSIEYSGLDEHFYVFAIRDTKYNIYLSWDELEYYAELFDFKIVPVIRKDNIKTEEEIKTIILDNMKLPSLLSNNKFFETEKEGLVVRIAREFNYDMFYNSVFKYVRKNHVKTDQHWNKNWKRAKLVSELEKINKIV